MEQYDDNRIGSLDESVPGPNADLTALSALLEDAIGESERSRAPLAPPDAASAAVALAAAAATVQMQRLVLTERPLEPPDCETACGRDSAPFSAATAAAAKPAAVTAIRSGAGRPTVISERVEPIALSRKTGLPLPPPAQRCGERAVGTNHADRRPGPTVVRDALETPEERRQRKQRTKQQRRVRARCPVLGPCFSPAAATNCTVHGATHHHAAACIALQERRAAKRATKDAYRAEERRQERLSLQRAAMEHARLLF